MRQFDWYSYGRIVRHLRKCGGFGNIKAFAASVTQATGVKVSEGNMKTIEQNFHAPKTDVFMAINDFLFGEPMPKQLARLYRGCDDAIEM